MASQGGPPEAEGKKSAKKEKKAKVKKEGRALHRIVGGSTGGGQVLGVASRRCRVLKAPSLAKHPERREATFLSG